jgi:integrase
MSTDLSPLKVPFRLSGICKGTLYRRARTPNSNWHLRVRITAEGRDFRICLKTTDLETATKLATKEAFKLSNIVESGQKVLGSTFKVLLGTFEGEQKLQASLGNLRKTTVARQALHLANGVRFLEAHKVTNETRLNAIDGHLFKQYLDWRKADCLAKTGGTITHRVVLQELCTIRKMFQLGADRAMCGTAQVPVFNVQVEKHTPRREAIDFKEWSKAAEILKAWAPADLALSQGFLSTDKAKDTDKRRAYVNKMRQVAFMVMSYTGMRPDECLQLRHCDLTTIDRAKGVVAGTIRAETQKTKTPKDRGFTLNKSPFGAAGKVSGINYLILWIDHWCKHKGADDFIFGQWSSGQKKIDEIGFMGDETPELKTLLVDADLAHLTPKHGRHWFITWLKERGIDSDTVANIVGNSPETIFKHYYHIDTKKVSDRLTRDAMEYDTDGVQVTKKAKKAKK